MWDAEMEMKLGLNDFGSTQLPENTPPAPGSYVLLKAFQQLCAPPGMKVTSGWEPSLSLVEFGAPSVLETGFL